MATTHTLNRADGTSAGQRTRVARDSSVDAIRIVLLVAVFALHAMMCGVSVGRRRTRARERPRRSALVRPGELGRADHAALLHRGRLLELPPLAVDALARGDRRRTTCGRASSGSCARRSRSWSWSPQDSPRSPSPACLPSSSRPRASASGSRCGSSASTSRSRRSCRSCCAPTSELACSRRSSCLPRSSPSTSPESRRASTRSASSTCCWCGCSCSSSGSTSPTARSTDSTAARSGASRAVRSPCW